MEKQCKINKIHVYLDSCHHGICPDCGDRLDYNRWRKEFYCLNRECAFVADLEGNRIWDNEMREQSIMKQINKDLKRDEEIRHQGLDVLD